MLSLQVKSPHTGMLFWSDLQKLNFHIPSKVRCNYAIRCAQFLWFQWWYIRPNSCIIDEDMITTRIITGFGKSVHRVIWRGFWHCLECHMSGLVIVESICLLLYGFQSNLISLESYFRGESNSVCYEKWGFLLMENIGNYRNCATRIIPEILVVTKSGLLLSGHLPFCPGCSPSVWHRFGWDLGHFGPETSLSLVGLWGSGYFYCGMGL